jgi:uncharacterized membrane protein YgcG
MVIIRLFFQIVFFFWLGIIFGPQHIAAQQYQLPDTGQTECYDNYGDTIICPIIGEAYWGQDGNYSIGSPKYKDNKDGTILDLNTGLFWQNDQKYADWEDARYECESLDLGGYNDWRIPERHELLSIVDYSRTDPAINTNFFPGTKSEYYWSNDWLVNIFIPNYAWCVDFTNGAAYFNHRTNVVNIRCVRGNTLHRDEFTNNGDGTVTDNSTGLVWQQSYNVLQPLQWDNALSHCEDLTLAGADDWRMPNIRELGSIIDIKKYDPTIDRQFFGCCGSYNGLYLYWSSTTTEDQPNYAMSVDFANGIAGVKWDKSIGIFVRCVRGDEVDVSTDNNDSGDDGSGGSSGESGSSSGGGGGGGGCFIFQIQNF